MPVSLRPFLLLGLIFRSSRICLIARRRRRHSTLSFQNFPLSRSTLRPGIECTFSSRRVRFRLPRKADSVRLFIFRCF